MNELQFGNKVRLLLNQSMRLDARVAERLRAARERALVRRKAEPRPLPVLRWADNVVGRFGGLGGFSLRLLLPVALLVVGLAAIYGWQRDQRASDIEEIDALLLADDLPIDAYLDRGFEAWLKKRSGR